MYLCQIYISMLQQGSSYYPSITRYYCEKNIKENEKLSSFFIFKNDSVRKKQELLFLSSFHNH